MSSRTCAKRARVDSKVISCWFATSLAKDVIRPSCPAAAVRRRRFRRSGRPARARSPRAPVGRGNRQNRCTGWSTLSAVAPEASNSRSMEAIARAVARTWSRRALARSSTLISSSASSSAYSSATFPISWRQPASMSLGGLRDADLGERVVLGLPPRMRPARACPDVRRGRRTPRMPSP